MNQKTSSSQLLKDGTSLVLVELIEQAGASAVPKVMIVRRQDLGTIGRAVRTPLIAHLLTWAILYREAVRTPYESILTLNPNSNPDMPDGEEMIGYLEKSIEILKKEWSYEFFFASECIKDRDDAIDVIMQPTMPGAFENCEFLVGANAAGIITRISSPSSRFPRPEPEATAEFQVTVKQGTKSFVLEGEDARRFLETDRQNRLKNEGKADVHFPTNEEPQA